ncbi:MAG TPA: hypothetical protein VN924_14885 [Bryobacteraceae bacterium]|nr:hypothetical protein [Bryobacteraceae bacterium]
MNWRFPALLGVVLLAGCDDTAIQFAKQTRALLDEYQKNINSQITEATKYYDGDVKIAKGAAASLLNDSLSVERTERATELAADYLEDRKPVSLYRTHIRPYAQVEYDARKGSLESAVDAKLPYEQQLAKLEADKETIEALGKALQALEEKRTLKMEGEDLEKFVADTKKDFSQEVCKELSTQTGDAEKTAAKDLKCNDAAKTAAK